MNNEPPVISTESAPVPKSSSLMPVLLGFLTGAIPWWLSLLQLPGSGTLPFLILGSLILPIISLVIAMIPKTRRFGLGLLIATGLGWLVLGAICGGLIG